MSSHSLLSVLGLSFLTLSFQISAATSHFGDTKLTAGDHSVKLTVGKLTREAEIHVPREWDGSTPIPVVIALHGGGGQAHAMREMTGLDSISDRQKFLLVYPQGTGKALAGHLFGTWNAKKCCGSAMKEDVDDVGFLSAIIDRLVSESNADPKRIFLTGMSNGAMMSYRAACKLSEKIAAIAPVAGDVEMSDCDLKQPVPVMHFHGTADRCSPYEGGPSADCFRGFLKSWLGISIPAQSWVGMSIPKLQKSWSEKNKALGPLKPGFKKGSCDCETYSPGDPRRETTLCSLKGMGHTWPGGQIGGPCSKRSGSRACRLYQAEVGPLTSEISASEMMWEFFIRHPKN